MSTITQKTKLKDLNPSILFQLRSHFDYDEKWKELAANIKDKKGNDKYTTSDVRNFSLEFLKGRSPTEALIQDWGYSNPAVIDFLRVLTKIKRIDVFHLFLVDIMKVISEDEFEEIDDFEEFLYEKWPAKTPAVKKQVSSPPSQRPVESDTSLCNIVEGNFSSCYNLQRDLHSEAPDDVTKPLPSRCAEQSIGKGMKYYRYDSLTDITDNWNASDIINEGRLLGSGGYGDVFLGRSTNGQEVAVKRLKLKGESDEPNTDESIKQFFEEVNTLINFIHPNIVRLLGVSQDGPHWCIIYEYMENGTLEDRLECKDNTPPLSGSQRCRIAKGIAQGLHFLHTNGTRSMVHRDIKSANILLDYDFSAKIGDCGLAHFGASDPKKSHTITRRVVGTKAYMPPEYMYGEVSNKFDAYSFGVVLYEMITGLAAYDESRSSHSLSFYIREHCPEDALKKETLEQYVDSKLDGKYSIKTMEMVFSMAHMLTAPEKHKRPTVTDVLEEIMSWPKQW